MPYFEVYYRLIEQVLTDRDDSIKSSVYANNIIIYGGFSSLRGTKEFFEEKLKRPVMISQADRTSLIGLGKIVSNKEILKKITANL